MLKNFLIKQAVKSRLKDVPQAEQDTLIDLIERNPAFFENLAKELQEGLASGKGEQAVMAELMGKYRNDIGKMIGK